MRCRSLSCRSSCALWSGKSAADPAGSLYIRYVTDGTIHILRSQQADLGNGTVGYGVGKLVTVALSCQNTGYVLYGNGKRILSGTFSVNFTGGGQPRIGYEGVTTGSDVANGVFPVLYVFNRSLSEKEIKQLTIDPYCFIKSPRRSYGGTAAGARRIMLTQ